MRLWIDTDIGDSPDDTIALWCAARDDAVELLGVSTVDGDEPRRVAFARSILPDTVEVVGGPPEPARLARIEAFLGIGPWSNAAKLAREHSLPPRVALMGGVLGPIKHRGEIQYVEHNVGRDPSAAHELLADTGGLLVVPLEATVPVELHEHEEKLLVERIPPLGPQLEEWRAANGPLPVVLHDPVALLVLTGEAIARLESRRLTVDPDGTMHASIDGPVQRVVAHVDAMAARARIRELAG